VRVGCPSLKVAKEVQDLKKGKARFLFASSPKEE